MVREIISLSLGQCGNQVASEFWNKSLRACGIGPDGLSEKNVAATAEDAFVNERSTVLFYESENSKYIPRAVLMDLEPRVVSSLVCSDFGHLFNTDSIWTSTEGGGAGNNWATGYGMGLQNTEAILSRVSNEVEACDSLEAFNVMHAISGGTGSGLGSNLLELLRENYPKKLVQTYSVFPSSAGVSDVVIEPYNAVLSLERLISCADAVHVIQNSSLYNICTERLHIHSPSNATTNGLIANAIWSMICPILYPSYMNSTLSSLLSPLIPGPKRHFLIDSVWPGDLMLENKNVLNNRRGKSSLIDVVMKSMDDKNFLSTLSSTNGSFIALSTIAHGNILPSTLLEALERVQEKSHLRFCKWAIRDIGYNIVPPIRHTTNAYSCLTVAHHTSFATTLNELHRRYTRLFSRKAFTDPYVCNSLFDGDAEFLRAEESLRNLMDQYTFNEDMTS